MECSQRIRMFKLNFSEFGEKRIVPVSILFTFKSFSCCASFSLRLLLLTTASETNRRCSSDMFTFLSTWRRSLRILLFHIPLEIACKNQRWTNFSSYGQSSSLARISTFSSYHLLHNKIIC